jgi:hypothetical protein
MGNELSAACCANKRPGKSTGASRDRFTTAFIAKASPRRLGVAGPDTRFDKGSPHYQQAWKRLEATDSTPSSQRYEQQPRGDSSEDGGDGDVSQISADTSVISFDTRERAIEERAERVRGEVEEDREEAWLEDIKAEEACIAELKRKAGEERASASPLRPASDGDETTLNETTGSEDEAHQDEAVMVEIADTDEEGEEGEGGWAADAEAEAMLSFEAESDVMGAALDALTAASAADAVAGTATGSKLAAETAGAADAAEAAEQRRQQEETAAFLRKLTEDKARKARERDEARANDAAAAERAREGARVALEAARVASEAVVKAEAREKESRSPRLEKKRSSRGSRSSRRSPLGGEGALSQSSPPATNPAQDLDMDDTTQTDPNHDNPRAHIPPQGRTSRGQNLRRFSSKESELLGVPSKARALMEEAPLEHHGPPQHADQPDRIPPPGRTARGQNLRKFSSKQSELLGISSKARALVEEDPLVSPRLRVCVSKVGSGDDSKVGSGDGSKDDSGDDSTVGCADDTNTCTDSAEDLTPPPTNGGVRDNINVCEAANVKKISFESPVMSRIHDMETRIGNDGDGGSDSGGDDDDAMWTRLG